MASTAGGGGGPPGLKFNKMFVMVPVMLAARKIPTDDPNIVYWLRIAYAVMQLFCVAVVGYTYIQATATAEKIKDTVVYIPPAATPFGADAGAKKKYTEKKYSEQVLSTARSLGGSTLFGIALTVGLHIYKGMVMGLAIQTIMAPLNLLENALVKAIFLGSGINPEDKIFEEKTAAELTADDEVVDEHGNPVVRQVGAAAAATGSAVGGKKEQSLEEIILDTWDMGNKADLGPLMKALNKKNCNYQTKEDNWTPLMILAGLGAAGTVSAIRTLKEMGADPAITDKEGWTALHWAAFHGSLPAALELRTETQILAIKDKDGNTPIDTARKEGNDKVADIFEEALGDKKKDK